MYTIKITNTNSNEVSRNPNWSPSSSEPKTSKLRNIPSNWATVNLAWFDVDSRIGFTMLLHVASLLGRKQQTSIPWEVLTSQHSYCTLSVFQDALPATGFPNILCISSGRISPMLDPSGAMLSDSNWTFTINQIIEALKRNKIAMVSRPSAKQCIKAWKISTQRGKHEPYQTIIKSTKQSTCHWRTIKRQYQQVCRAPNINAEATKQQTWRWVAKMPQNTLSMLAEKSYTRLQIESISQQDVPKIWFPTAR